MKMKQFIVNTLKAALVAMCTFVGVPAQSATLDISDVPLFVGGTVEPNIMFTLDDSGSMYWSFMPDDIYGLRNTNRAKSPEINGVYYNPRTNYVAPSKSDGSRMPNASFTAAWDDGYAANDGLSVTTNGCVRDLSTQYRPSWYYGNNCNGWDEYSWEYAQGGTGPAYYYIYYTNHPAGGQPRPAGCSDSLNDDDCYIRVNVSSTSGVGGADERQNFANWYSYYRRRLYTAKAGVGRAFAQMGSGMRVGFDAINNFSSILAKLPNPVSGYGNINRGVQTFKGTSRDEFFDLLYAEQATGATPLRRAAGVVGEYFRSTSNNGPWSDNPSTGVTNAHLSCRQSYHIIMSDGYWTTSSWAQAGTSAARADNDSSNGPSHTYGSNSFSFSAVSPFRDGRSNTLADAAMYYWKNDLRSDLDDKVPTSSEDPAFWQHLVSFTVGLGVQGTIDPTTAFAAIDSGATITWPNPFSTNPAKIDDMLHAAVNSRGGFYSAADPDGFANALVDALNTVIERISSASAVALNSGALSSSSKLYQARFDTANWSGQLMAFKLDSQGNPVSGGSTSSADFLTSSGKQTIKADWDIGNDSEGLIPAYNSRKIVTMTSLGAKPFRFSQLDTTQQGLLGSAAMVDYLRGDATNEQKNGGTYRNRSSKLGDIVNSAPILVGPPSAPYPDYWGAGATENVAPYSAFKASKYNRKSILAVGANDGMLHLIDADNGEERMAYVPNAVIKNLPQLANPKYTHRYFVDGTVNATDAFWGSSWKTVMVGGLRAGGQAVFALNLTGMPGASISETSAANKVLWEFDDSDDKDMGYSYSRPNIVRMANGTWAAVFGNGYNNTLADGNVSSTGNAVLYIVNIKTGAIIKKIDTKEGSADDPTGLGRPNGLGPVATVDTNGDFIVDMAYAGDLFGNIWKFDLSSTAKSGWGVAYGTKSKPVPLFTARAKQSDATTAQPITSRLQVARHPDGLFGYMVYFGTGKYIEVGENTRTGQTTQSFYAIWDKDQRDKTSGKPTLTAFDKNDLLQQKVTAELVVSGNDYRVTSDNAIENWDVDSSPPPSGQSEYMGWYMDMYNTQGGNTNNYGERIISPPLLRGDRVIFVTLIPSDDACDYGGDGWLMELSASNGGRLPVSPFDVNHDGVFDKDDKVTDPNTNTKVVIGGRKSKIGIIPTPGIADDFKNDKQLKFESGSTGTIEVISENPDSNAVGRQSWQQLFE